MGAGEEGDEVSEGDGVTGEWVAGIGLLLGGAAVRPEG